MIPPRPWRVTSLRPDDHWVYIVDAQGAGVLEAAVERELADFLVRVVNEREP